MENEKNFENVLLNNKSMLNLEAQKELVNHTIAAITKNALKMFAIVLPLMIVFVLGIILAVFYFTGIIK